MEKINSNIELLTATKSTLGQLTDLLGQLSQEQFAGPLDLISGTSIGQHVRHIVEFYVCLSNGFPMGNVNYDARERNLQLEVDRDFVIDTLARLLSEMEAWDMKTPLTLKARFSADLETESALETTVERELMYNLEHTIHHLAIIKIAVKNCFADVTPDENLGVAPSTIRYREAECAQ